MWIKDYYCEHCGQFRGKGQIYLMDRGPCGMIPHCRYCNRVVIRTDVAFKKFVEEMVNKDI